MNVGLLGMPQREAAALRMFVDVAMPGWKCSVHSDSGDEAPAAASAWVAHVTGLGLGPWTPRAEADLLLRLRGRGAVLILPPHERSWEQAARASANQRILALVQPYGSDQMRQALLELGRGSPPQLAARQAPAEPAVAATAPDFQPGDQALPALFPQLEDHLLLKRLLAIVSSGRPRELRPTLKQVLIVHPAAGWIAHNTDPGLLERLDGLPSAVSAMGDRELTAAEAEERVQRLQLTPLPLDTFVWRLADAVLGPETPRPRRDASFSLRAFPGFTRIRGASNLHLQLAAICVRVPQTLSGLRAVFPRATHAEIARFVLLSTLCGLGRLSLVVPAASAAPAVPHIQRASAAPRGDGALGFVRSLLQKLL